MIRFRVATWNIRKCVGLDRRRNPHRTVEVIAGLNADIVALQEADKRLGRRPAALTETLIEDEAGLSVVDAGAHSPSIGWHGNAVLVSDRVKPLACHRLHLPGIEPRGALLVEVEIEHRPLRIVATHLGFLRRSRRAQLATIRSRLEAMDDMPTVALGDFNEWSDLHGLEPLSGFEVHAPGRTFHTARPVASLDRVAVQGGVTLEDAGVVRDRLTRVASDHLPVWAGLKLG